MSDTINDTQLMKVWAAVFLAEDIGIRVVDVATKCMISTNTARCFLGALVDQGFVQFRMQQVGTGGTQERFYQPCPDSAVLQKK